MSILERYLREQDWSKERKHAFQCMVRSVVIALYPVREQFLISFEENLLIHHVIATFNSDNLRMVEG